MLSKDSLKQEIPREALKRYPKPEPNQCNTSDLFEKPQREAFIAGAMWVLKKLKRKWKKRKDLNPEVTP